MIHVQILFFVVEIGTSKNLIFHLIFLNKDISVTTLDIMTKASHNYPCRWKRVSDFFSFRP